MILGTLPNWHCRIPRKKKANPRGKKVIRPLLGCNEFNKILFRKSVDRKRTKKQTSKKNTVHLPRNPKNIEINFLPCVALFWGKIDGRGSKFDDEGNISQNAQKFFWTFSGLRRRRLRSALAKRSDHCPLGDVHTPGETNESQIMSCRNRGTSNYWQWRTATWSWEGHHCLELDQIIEPPESWVRSFCLFLLNILYTLQGNRLTDWKMVCVCFIHKKTGVSTVFGQMLSQTTHCRLIHCEI